jgi:hypothetical protein
MITFYDKYSEQLSAKRQEARKLFPLLLSLHHIAWADRPQFHERFRTHYREAVINIPETSDNAPFIRCNSKEIAFLLYMQFGVALWEDSSLNDTYTSDPNNYQDGSKL